MGSAPWGLRAGFSAAGTKGKGRIHSATDPSGRGVPSRSSEPPLDLRSAPQAPLVPAALRRSGCHPELLVPPRGFREVPWDALWSQDPGYDSQEPALVLSGRIYTHISPRLDGRWQLGSALPSHHLQYREGLGWAGQAHCLARPPFCPCLFCSLAFEADRATSQCSRSSMGRHQG